MTGTYSHCTGTNSHSTGTFSRCTGTNSHCTWATTQNNLGSALTKIARKTREPHVCREAIACYDLSLEVLNPEGSGHYHAMTTRQRARAVELLKELENSPPD